MNDALLLSIRFHDGRYHGAGDWPPAPARLFQALVAGAARGFQLGDEDVVALEWLETLDPPVIAAPTVREGQSFTNFVPNNDLDKYGGDPRKIGEIRTPKTVRPHMFNAETPLLFIWTFDNDPSSDGHARTVCQIAERLYQLGRGVDMAWAWGELLDADEVKTRLALHGGAVYRPSKSGTDKALLCPAKGSLASLKVRHDANRTRFTYAGKQQLFSQPPKPRFAKVAYDTPTGHILFEIREATSDESFAPWPSPHAAELVLALRDKAADRLKNVLPEEAGTIDRVLIGRGATEVDKAARVRIVPLPSIGHVHADRRIRRVLVEIPPNCPLRADDVAWAFSGLDEIDFASGAILWSLIQAEERGTLGLYGISDSEQDACRIWRTVTPAALPVRRMGRGATGAKRIAGEEQAALAVTQALRHAGVTVPAESVRVQREPFDRNGTRAEDFAVPGRFASRGLHHVEIAFAQAVRGPLVIGNGRYLGLGLMAPRKNVWHDVFAFALPAEPNVHVSDARALLLAVRRALMALSKEGSGRVPRLFSGHEDNGPPARSGRHEHVFLAADGVGSDGLITKFIVAAPWAADRRVKPWRDGRRRFDETMRRLTELRAGRLGRFDHLKAKPVEDSDPLLGPANIWMSETLYVATRNLKKHDEPDMVVKADVAAECRRRGLPVPVEIHVSEVSVGPRGGRPAAKLILHFAVAVPGPFILGRDSHTGGGLFHAASPSKTVWQGDKGLNEERRNAGWWRVMESMDNLAAEALENGLTDTTLKAFLADES
ncbi:MAG: type I-U CRISPR-associated protein Csb2 [Candidatus Tectomicrobia bacterium]|nr:type I-U CRISPR-associated protein Csb2 [Candidatus Tectomicrobia bacterium]